MVISPPPLFEGQKEEGTDHMDTLPLLLFRSSALQHLLSWCWGSLKGVRLLSGSTWEVLPLQGRLKGLAATGQTAEWMLLHAHRRIKASGMKRAEPTQCLQRLPRRGGHFVHSLVHRLADQGQALVTGTRPLPCGGPAGQGQPGRFGLSCPSTDRMMGVLGLVGWLALGGDQSTGAYSSLTQG